jgi:cold shock CspA family protein/ribosome-associated translation inhibitor RaiA
MPDPCMQIRERPDAGSMRMRVSMRATASASTTTRKGIPMIPPVQTTFRNMRSRVAIEEQIRAEVAKLATFYDRMTNCRVVIEVPHKHHRSGQHYHIRIDLTVPGGELVVMHQPSLRHAIQQMEVDKGQKDLEVDAPHDDLYVAIGDAFVAARRRLQDYAHRQRGAVKGHVEAPHARVIRLLPEEGYGFLETADGVEIYFHRNSVMHDAFDRLTIGTEVRFVAEEGDNGLQASTVRLVGGQHIAPAMT